MKIWRVQRCKVEKVKKKNLKFCLIFFRVCIFALLNFRNLFLVVPGFVREGFAGYDPGFEGLKVVPRMAMIPFQLPRTAGSWTFVIRELHTL